MIDEVVIWNVAKMDEERETVIEIKNYDSKEKAVDRLQALDAKWGFDLGKSYSYLNRYENDDYLFCADLLQDVAEIHRKIYFDPSKGQWIRGCYDIPYCHFMFEEKGAYRKTAKGTIEVDDAALNMGVKEPTDNGSHIIYFNYYWLRQYVLFLQTVFDDNEELIIENARGMESEYATREGLLDLAERAEKDGYLQQAQLIRQYAQSVREGDVVAVPAIVKMDIGEEHIDTLAFIDERRNVLQFHLKKSIYLTSGFHSFFSERRELISEVFISSLKMILGHEIAHVARGHWNLRVQEPEFSLKREVMLNCEINADWTSAKWLINELLYDTIDGDPHSNQLAYTYDRFEYLISIRIFSAYLALSWGYHDERRSWTPQTMEEFRENLDATHPIFHIRTACLLSHLKSHLEHMKETCANEEGYLCLADGKKVDGALYVNAWNNAMNMIFSYEASCRECWGPDDRETLEKLRESARISLRSSPEDMCDIPFMIVFLESTQEELNKIESWWKPTLEKLRKYGMPFPM